MKNWLEYIIEKANVKQGVFLCLMLIFTMPSFAQIPLPQGQTRKLIQFSGIVVTGDSLMPVPFTTIMVKGSGHGTVADYYGFFSFVAQQGDVIEFSALGFKKALFNIPDTLDENRYSIIQMMFTDTFLLREAVIFPWPTREQFKHAFLTLDIPDDDLVRAQKNLRRSEMRETWQNMGMDASANHRFAMDMNRTKLYYAGQLPPNNLLNPIAWSKFIKAWKNGDFNRKD
jgi:hypothetical protein